MQACPPLLRWPSPSAAPDTSHSRRPENLRLHLADHFLTEGQTRYRKSTVRRFPNLDQNWPVNCFARCRGQLAWPPSKCTTRRGPAAPSRTAAGGHFELPRGEDSPGGRVHRGSAGPGMRPCQFHQRLSPSLPESNLDQEVHHQLSFEISTRFFLCWWQRPILRRSALRDGHTAPQTDPPL